MNLLDCFEQEAKNRHVAKCTQKIAKAICDWICEKGSYMRNYKYLEIPI